ncbi:MAG: hypothetical protein ABIU09_07325 [Pyrinomonadaceae bacterium]
MILTLRQKIYAVLIALSAIAAGVVATSVWSNYQIAKLESAVDAAKYNAKQIETNSRKLGQKAAGYEQKIRYLETSLSELESIARNQDEKLKELANDTNTARDSVRHARSVRAIESTNDELCAKLAKLGHPCGG